VVRRLAKTPTEVQTVFAWPIREGLLAYRDALREDLTAQWRHETTAWALLAPWQASDGRTPPPEVPDLLRSP
jgi:hypothetical protein